MAPHSSPLAWKTPWAEESGRLQSMGSRRVGHDWATSLSFHLHALQKEMAAHCSVLAWRIPGTGEPGGLPSMGSHRAGHDWSDLAAAAEVDDYKFSGKAAAFFPTTKTREIHWEFLVSWSPLMKGNISGIRYTTLYREFFSKGVCVRVRVAQSCPTLCDPMDYIACQAPLSMEFSRQQYWSGLPFPSPFSQGARRELFGDRRGQLREKRNAM